MTGITVDVANVEPLGPDELADTLRFRDHEFRTRIIQVMLLAELALVPLPPEVTAEVESYAGRLGVCDDIMRVAREVSHGSMGLALIDFERSGYFQHLLDRPPEVFGLISRANDDPAAFALLAMVFGLFETGYIEAGATKPICSATIGSCTRTGRSPTCAPTSGCRRDRTSRSRADQ